VHLCFFKFPFEWIYAKAILNIFTFSFLDLDLFGILFFLYVSCVFRLRLFNLYELALLIKRIKLRKLQESLVVPAMFVNVLKIGFYVMI